MTLRIDDFSFFLGIAPSVFNNRCIPPCTPCTQKQARKAIVFMQRNYPKQFGRLVVEHTSRRG